jgi:hypothetical protein
LQEAPWTVFFPWWSETRPTPPKPREKGGRWWLHMDEKVESINELREILLRFMYIGRHDDCTWMKVESINELCKIFFLLKQKVHPYGTLFYPIIVIPIWTIDSLDVTPWRLHMDESRRTSMSCAKRYFYSKIRTFVHTGHYSVL